MSDKLQFLDDEKRQYSQEPRERLVHPLYRKPKLII